MPIYNPLSPIQINTSYLKKPVIRDISGYNDLDAIRQQYVKEQVTNDLVRQEMLKQAQKDYAAGYDMEAPGSSKYYNPSWGNNTCIGWACENARKAEVALGLEPSVKVIPSNKEFINQVDKGNIPFTKVDKQQPGDILQFTVGDIPFHSILTSGPIEGTKVKAFSEGHEGPLSNENNYLNPKQEYNLFRYTGKNSKIEEDYAKKFEQIYGYPYPGKKGLPQQSLQNSLVKL